MKFSSFDKTEKGREEIATRKHGLSSRLRTMLLLFDGKNTVREVLQKVAGIGLAEQHINELLALGLIQQCEVTASAPLAAPIVPIVPQRRISMPASLTPPVARPTPAPVPMPVPISSPVLQAKTPAPVQPLAPVPASIPASAIPAPITPPVQIPAAAPAPPQILAPTPIVAPAASVPISDDMPAADETLLQTIYNFYTETIRSAVGLRGYALQIKVERARSIEDFRKMRSDYLAAVEKAQGPEAARELDRRLQLLLDAEPSSAADQT